MWKFLSGSKISYRRPTGGLICAVSFQFKAGFLGQMWSFKRLVIPLICFKNMFLCEYVSTVSYVIENNLHCFLLSSDGVRARGLGYTSQCGDITGQPERLTKRESKQWRYLGQPTRGAVCQRDNTVSQQCTERKGVFL